MVSNGKEQKLKFQPQYWFLVLIPSIQSLVIYTYVACGTVMFRKF